MADVTDKPVVKDDASSNKKIGPDGAKKALDGKNGKMKWYLVGGLGVVAVLVFFFVSRSKTNAAGGSTASGTSGGTLDPSTEAALESALQAQASGGGFASTATGSTGATGPAGAAGPAGPAGPTGATGPASAKTSTLPVATSSKYTVKAGDTLASLSSKFGISIGTLAHANTYVKGEAAASKVGQQLGTGAGLKTGQVLTVPHKV
jgi:LysM repeat protein